MQNELDELKFRLLVKQGKVDQDARKTIAENTVLREYIQEQHVTLAAAQAALNGHVQRSLGTQQPAQSVIRLGTDRAERYNTLDALKERKLYEAERYLAARSQGLQCGATYCQEERFESIDGDFCIIRFDTAPIRRASVKTVFDALLGSILNAEMFLSTCLGALRSVKTANSRAPRLHNFDWFH